MKSISAVAARTISAAIHLSSAMSTPIAQSTSAFRIASRTILIPNPTGPEKNPTARTSHDGLGTLVGPAMGTLVTAVTGSFRSPGPSSTGSFATTRPRSGRLQGSRATGDPRVADPRSAPATQPIFCAMLFWAPMNDLRAGIDPEPFVERTQAAPRSPQTLAICGMFGIGTPPTEALPNDLQVSVLHLCTGGRVRREAAVRGCERELRRRAGPCSWPRGPSRATRRRASPRTSSP